MRVVHIVTLGDLYYGAQNHVLHLTEAGIAEGQSVKILVGSTGVFTDMLEERNIDFDYVPAMTHPINPIKDVIAILKIRSIIKQFKADVVTTHSTKAGIVGRMAAWSLKIPCTFTAHGWSFAEGLPIRRRRFALLIEKFVAKITNRVIAVAEKEREFGLSQNVTTPKKLVRIYYGVADEAGGPIEHAPHADPVVLSMVAGFRPQKDHATLIRALASIPDVPWTLNFIGDGELMESVKKIVTEHNLDDRIVFTGAVSDVSNYLKKTDIQVLTTYYEGLPISTIEGLAHSLPVIATDVAGTVEQVVDGHNGITVEREDDLAVAQAIRLLVEDSELRLKYGKNSRALYEEKFTNEQMCKNTFDLYKELLAETSS